MYANNAAVNRNDIQGLVMQSPELEQMLVADHISPFQPTEEQHFRYPLFSNAKSGLIQAPDQDADPTLVKPGDAYPRLKDSFEYQQDSTIKRGMEYPVADIHARQLNGKSGFNFEVYAANRLTRATKLGREIRLSRLLTNSNNGINRTDAGFSWESGNLATGDFVGNILDAIERMNNKGYIANAIIIPFGLIQLIKRSTSFKDYGKNFGIKIDTGDGSTSSITDNDIVAAFAEHGIEKLIIPRGSYQSNNEGTDTVSTAKLWAQDFAMVTSIRDGALENGGLSRTMHWDAGAESPYQVQTYRDEQHESDIVRVKQFDKERIIDPAAAEYINVTQ